MEWKLIQKEEACASIQRMYTLKPLYSNYFNQSLDETDLYCSTEHSFVLLKKQEGLYSRVYLLSDNIDDISTILKALKGTYVVNIPSKGDILDWERLMHISNFQKLATYERFHNTQVKKRGNLENIRFATMEQERGIQDLFYNYFSPYIDYLPTCAELQQLIKQKQVIVNYEKDLLCGAFIFSIEGRKCYFRAWIDNGQNGLKLLFDVYNIMYEKKIAYAYFWVNVKNENVKSIHKLLGAQSDNLKDYTFLKQ